MWTKIMRQIVKFLDPKLEQFRDPTPPPKPYTPKSLPDFIALLRRTPKSILSTSDRDRIAAVMSFDDRTVGELMIPKKDIIFVNNDEILGPLTLDKLYKSGFTNFPVIDKRGNVKGILHTEALNTLEIKHTERADKYMSKSVQYLHSTDSLKFAVEEIERTNSYFFLVLDSHDSLIGFFTIKLLLSYLLG